ncbi:MAG: apolipoprotein N-acyltransferase [Chlorobiaceae bacterium]|nr:apolipoprotein N-acyltransferase [Chlorobiaceae bacterium]
MNRKNSSAASTAYHSNILLPLLSGLLLGISFPTWPSVHLEPLAWVALVPLLLSVGHEERFGPYFRKVWSATTLFCLISLWWVSLATFVGGILTIFVQSLFSTVPFLLWFLVKRRTGSRIALISFPFIWTGWEWAYMQQDFSLGWLTIGNSQANLLWMVQYADITGVWGVSFWIIAFNVLVLSLVRSWGQLRKVGAIVTAMVVMIVAPLLYAWRVFDGADREAAGRTVRVALVQPDIDPHEKWGGLGSGETMALLLRLTGRNLVTAPADLVLWPETAIPFYIRDPGNEIFLSALRRSVDLWNTPLLTGFPDGEMPPRALASRDAGTAESPGSGKPLAAYNASMLLQPGDGGVQIYRKMRLVPFGERVPYSDYLPWLERLSFSLSGITSWHKGQEATVMTVRAPGREPFRMANIICYESIFPGLVSEFVARGAQLLTLVTNDGWYGTSYGPWQHAAIGRLRCIENRRSMARCANTGVTLFYDRYGRTIAETPWWQETVLTADVPLESDLSWYTRHPDLFPEACLGIAALLGLFARAGRTSGKERE